MDKFLKIVFTVVLSVFKLGLFCRVLYSYGGLFYSCLEKIVPEESKTVESDLLFFFGNCRYILAGGVFFYKAVFRRNTDYFADASRERAKK